MMWPFDLRTSLWPRSRLAFDIWLTHCATVVSSVARTIRWIWGINQSINQSAVGIMCCHPIFTGRQTCGRTSQGHTGERSNLIFPLSFWGACPNFYREKGSVVSLVHRVLRIYIAHTGRGRIMELWFYMGFVTPPIHFGRVILYVWSSPW